MVALRIQTMLMLIIVKVVTIKKNKFPTSRARSESVWLMWETTKKVYEYEIRK